MIVVFKKGGRLRKEEKWIMNGQVIEILKEMNYLVYTM
jgi:hypothetical protein